MIQRLHGEMGVQDIKMIRPLRYNGLQGYIVLDDKTNAGLAMYRETGNYMGKSFDKIRISEVFLTKETKMLKFKRMPLTDYEKEKRTRNHRVSVQIHMFPLVIEALSMFLKDLGLEGEGQPHTSNKQDIKDRSPYFTDDELELLV